MSMTRVAKLKYIWSTVVGVVSVSFCGFLIGSYIDRLNDETMASFRDKSALYGRTLAPGERPSWP